MQDQSTEQQLYYPVSMGKFLLMSLCTFGLYDIYWSYKSWHYIRARDNSRILPAARAIFLPFWYYALLKDISRHESAGALRSKPVCILLALTYLLLNTVISAVLPDPYWPLSLLFFLLLVPAVQAIQRINCEQGITEFNSHHRARNLATYALGGGMIALAIAGSLLVPQNVVPGHQLWASQVAFLRDEGFLTEGENILYFYSNGMFSIEDEGQFISDYRVVSYVRDEEDGALYGGNVTYSRIANIEVDWSSAPLEYTVVQVTTLDDGPEFELWLPTDDGGDKTFVRELKRRWKQAGDEDELPQPSEPDPWYEQKLSSGLWTTTTITSTAPPAQS